jgi:serine/threonine protein kinase
VRLVTLLPPDKAESIDRYQLIGEIASGGMASVFLARLDGAGGFKRMVAIKRLHPHLASERDFVEMFLDEARIAAAIHHRNVVPIVEIGNTNAGFYLVMEYIEGATLSRLGRPRALATRPVALPILLRIVLDGLTGLHASHAIVDENGAPLELVHRDCSPQNLLVGLDGCTRLADFGVARARVRIHKTRPGATKGKLLYMAPELAQGDNFDRRADVFSMGVVLWEVLAARTLFDGSNEVEILTQLLHAPIPRLDEVNPRIPSAIADVCAQALAREPDERFATASAMALALESAAVASGGTIASEREVERFMNDRYGARAEKQRAALRGWFQGVYNAPSEGPPASSETPQTPGVAAVVGPSSPSSPRPSASLPMAPISDANTQLAAYDAKDIGSAPSLARVNERVVTESVAPKMTERPVSREIEAAVSGALARRGVGGMVILREDVLELRSDDGPSVAIDVGEWVSQWNLLPPDMRDRRAESAAARLQSSVSGEDARPAADPVARAYARERWRNRIMGLGVVAGLAAGGWWLWSAGFFGAKGASNIPSFPGFGDEPAPTATADAYEQTGVRVRRACEVARQQLMAGLPMGVDVEGWVVELWLAKDGEVDGMKGHRALRRLEKEGAVGELAVQAPGEISLHPLDIEGSTAVLVRLGGGYAVPFFQSDGRGRYLSFAERLVTAVGARHAGLYARCAHMPSRDVGAWFAGKNKNDALAAMLWTTGEPAALGELTGQLGKLDSSLVQDALRGVGAREQLLGKGGTTLVALRLPLGGATSAAKASRKLREAVPE